MKPEESIISCKGNPNLIHPILMDAIKDPTINPDQYKKLLSFAIIQGYKFSPYPYKTR